MVVYGRARLNWALESFAGNFPVLCRPKLQCRLPAVERDKRLGRPFTFEINNSSENCRLSFSLPPVSQEGEGGEA